MKPLSRLLLRFTSLLLLVPMSILSPAGVAQAPIALVATGSSLPEPLYVLWADEYRKQFADIQIRYLPEGTAESAKRILSGTGDFGGGDAPIPEKELKSARGKMLELPTVLICIVVIYNLPGIEGDLRVSGPVLSDIFLGKVKMWNDPALLKLNPQMKLPALPIQVVHRAEGKGSNYIFSDYLSKVSPEFLAKAGRGESPSWPVGASTVRAQDMGDKVRSMPGAIGYTELYLAQGASLRIARVKNAAGEFVKPTVKTVAAAALGVKMPDDFRISLTNAPGKESYPISSFTWLYVPSMANDAVRGQAVADYLKWVYTEGQKIAQEQGYAVLPNEVLEKVRTKASAVR